MLKPPRQASDSLAFDELLESRLRQLLTSIDSISLEDVAAEVTSLGQLIKIYQRNDELLEGLLDPATSSDKRSQIREKLTSQRLRVRQNKAQFERLHAKSHELLARSVRLLAMVDRQVYRKTNIDSSYAPEICGYCEGQGDDRSGACPACNGKRTVLVYQPPLVCPRCNGVGKANPAEQILYSSTVCIVCRGKGWALALDRC